MPTHQPLKTKYLPNLATMSLDLWFSCVVNQNSNFFFPMRTIHPHLDHETTQNTCSAVAQRVARSLAFGRSGVRIPGQPNHVFFYICVNWYTDRDKTLRYLPLPFLVNHTAIAAEEVLENL
jgi:hypothetical protein